MHVAKTNNIITWLTFFELDPVIRETARTEKKTQYYILVQYEVHSTHIIFKLYFLTKNCKKNIMLLNNSSF